MDNPRQTPAKAPKHTATQPTEAAEPVPDGFKKGRLLFYVHVLKPREHWPRECALALVCPYPRGGAEKSYYADLLSNYLLRHTQVPEKCDQTRLPDPVRIINQTLYDAARRAIETGELPEAVDKDSGLVDPKAFITWARRQGPLCDVPDYALPLAEVTAQDVPPGYMPCAKAILQIGRAFPDWPRPKCCSMLSTACGRDKVRHIGTGQKKRIVFEEDVESFIAHHEKLLEAKDKKKLALLPKAPPLPREKF